MANTLSFIDQLQGANYQSLSTTDFKVGIIDADTANLTSAQLGSLKSAGKTIIGYLSVGEAEDYRSYWNSSWNTNPPSFLLGENPNWPGDYNVKFWDPNWQNLVINQAVSLAKAGYNGIMLDVVDAYSVPSVAAAAGGIANARAAMVNFVEHISAAAKAVNPNFKIIQNNALDLLTTNPDNPASATNSSYLSHIDGVLAESTFYNSDNSHTSWSAWNAQYLDHAVAAGKTVLSIDYPTSAAAQQDYIKQATAHGYVPYVATEALDNHIAAVDYQIPSQLHAGALNSVVGSAVAAVAPVVPTTPAASTTATHPVTTTTHPATTTAVSTPAPSPAAPAFDHAFAASHNVVTAANGNTTMLGTKTNMEFVFGSNYHGNATLKYFATDSGDVIDVASNIFSSVAQALQHVSYSGHNAIVNLNGHGTITVVNAGQNSLTAEDFHIG